MAAKRTADEVKNLEVVGQFVAPYVEHNLQAALVRFAAIGLFARNREFCRTHPANNFYSSALDALEQTTLVRIAEILKAGPFQSVAPKIRQRGEVFLHRHTISHPLTVKWEKPAMVQFVQQGRHKFNRQALLWDMQRSINDELRQHGKKIHNETIAVRWEMAVMLEAITRAAVKPEHQGMVIPAQTLVGHLEAFRNAYLEFLEEIPDGHPRSSAPTRK